MNRSHRVALLIASLGAKWDKQKLLSPLEVKKQLDPEREFVDIPVTFDVDKTGDTIYVTVLHKGQPIGQSYTREDLMAGRTALRMFPQLLKPQDKVWRRSTGG